MTLKEISQHAKAQKDGEVITFHPSGRVRISAQAVERLNLKNYVGVVLLEDEDNPYYLGFRFTSSLENPNAYKLSNDRNRKSGGLSFAAKGLLKRSPIIKAIAAAESVRERTFPLRMSRSGDHFAIEMRPAFEHRVEWRDRNIIPAQVAGIYRYLDGHGAVLYIGKGNVKERAASHERREWGVKVIEYSPIDIEETAFYWEHYYLQEFRTRFGVLPTLNRVEGHNKSSRKRK